WLRTNLESARGLSVKYGSGGELSPEEIDVVYGRWTVDGNEDARVIVDSLGAAFGQFLVDHHYYEWIVYSDHHGPEYAVRHKTLEAIAFPRASIEKRIPSGEIGFFADIHLAILDHLSDPELKRRDAGNAI